MGTKTVADGVGDPGRVGRCYENAGAYAIELYLMGGAKGWELVHGRARLTRPPFDWFGHAWLEYRPPDGSPGVVLDVQKIHLGIKPLAIAAAQYYRVGRVERSQTFRYSPERVAEIVRRLKHWGPWEGIEAAELKPEQKL